MVGSKCFRSDENGAVTIDWVALAAGLLILSVGIVGLLTDELQSVVDGIEAELASATDVTAPGENGGTTGGGDGFTPVSFCDPGSTGSACITDLDGDGIIDGSIDANGNPDASRNGRDIEAEAASLNMVETEIEQENLFNAELERRGADPFPLSGT